MGTPFCRCLPLLGLALLCLTGCVVNRYKETYVPSASVLAETFVKGEPGAVAIRPVKTESEVLDAIEEGYIPLGNSSFTDTHCPWACAITMAEEIGADLVLIDEAPKGTEVRTSVLYLPSYHHSYSYGTTSATSYGAYGAHTTYGSYSGSTTSTSYHAMPVQYVVEIYEQTAMFLRKGTWGDFYGAILQQSPRLPDEADDTEAPVRVFAVLKGSRAQKEGLTRNQRVVAINGKPIRTRADFAPFAEAPMSINSVEVAQ